MRRFISVALCATSFIALSVAANAADQVEEPVQSGFNWTGFHLGFGVGAGAAVTELGIPPSSVFLIKRSNLVNNKASILRLLAFT